MSTLAIIRGTIINDAFYFSLRVNGETIDNMLHDTGAFELTFNGALKLDPNSQKLKIIS